MYIGLLKSNVSIIPDGVKSKLFKTISTNSSSDFTPELSAPISNMKEVTEWCKKFFGVLISTKDKYKTLLDIYASHIEKLMNPVKTSREAYHTIHREEDYDNDVATKDLYNDTPETTDVVATLEDNQYVSNLSKGTAHTDNIGETDENGSNAETINNDYETTMKRIAEIQESFQKVLYNWSEEFKMLFIEPLNV